MRFKVSTPVEKFTGNVVGVDFANGTAEVDGEQRQALSYFREAGYGIEPLADEAPEPPAEPPTPTPAEPSPAAPEPEPEPVKPEPKQATRKAAPKPDDSTAK
jgi:outer membrane biosynthesis protein TonB